MRLSRFWPLAVAAVLLAACGQRTEDPGDPAPAGGERMKPLVEQFRDARTRASSDFERQALDRAISTGRIDAADYEEASSRYRRCLTDAGITDTFTKLPNGIYRANPVEQADPQAYVEKTGNCAMQTGLARIEALYRTQVDNPDLLADPRLVIVRCLLKAGLVPADYTADKLGDFLRSKDMPAEAPANFDPMTPEAQTCLTAGGVAVNLDDEPQKGGN